MPKLIYRSICACVTVWLNACGGGSATAPQAISVAYSPQPPASLAVRATTSLIAVVINDDKNAGVSWKAACDSSQCGSFSSGTTPSASQTIYSAPSAVSSSLAVTITATSLADSSKSASATISITPTGSPAVLSDGAYVFHLSGQGNTGPYFVVGAFTVKDGLITKGEQDVGDAGGGYTDNLVAAGCSLTTVGENIQIVLDTGDGNIGVNGIETLRGTLVSSSRAVISEFDASAAGTGSLDLQTGTAAPDGGYVFAIAGQDNATLNQLVIGGVLNINATELSVKDSVFDLNDGGNVEQAQTFASGSVSVPDPLGRITFNLFPSSASSVPGFVLTGYIVGPNRIQLVENQSDALGADLGGTALGQGVNTGGFSQASVLNTSYVHGSAGADSNGALTLAGGFHFDPDGTVSGKLALNDLVHSVSNTITGGTYRVDPTGRVTLTGVLPENLNVPLNFQLYLDGNGNALELGVDQIQATAGLAFLQTAPLASFAGSYAIAGQGLLNIQGQPFWGTVGAVTVNSGTFNGSTDYTVQGSAPNPAVKLTGSADTATGLLSLTGLNATSFQTANSYGYYPIDATRVLAIEIDGQQLGLLVLEGIVK
jgi:hypothetical protein